MTRRLKTVTVCVDLEHFQQPFAMGLLRCQASASGDVFSFEYDREWLGHPEAFSFDPDLLRVPSPHYPPPSQSNFGVFMDSSPDRWGRLLMQRRENSRARRENRSAKSLTEWDFLLGVHDETRLGALRFRSPDGDRFIEDDAHLAAPPIASLRDLQHASLQFERHINDDDHPEYERWLSQLFAPGTSLGGARPKASIRDEKGVLCLAKFPSRQDTRDVGAWEILAHRLAVKAGIRVSDARALRLSGSPHTTFLSRRFDRDEYGKRRAFVSAMTLAQRTDGEAGASYLELVDLLQSRGTETHRDCIELFRRVLFNICIHNTDDHLRNHGFIIKKEGISLSPAFDINPTHDRNQLTLAINEVDTTCDVAIAMDARAQYGLSKIEADRVFADVTSAVETWPEEATRLRIPKSEQREMAAAFKLF